MTFAYNPYGRWTGSHQMTINGKREGIERDDIMQCARAMDISKHHAENICNDVLNAVQRWAAFAETAGVREQRAMQLQNAFPKL